MGSRGWADPRLVAVLAAAFVATFGLAVWLYLSGRPPGDGSAEAGFARDMMVHHAQAVGMAEIVRDKTENEDVRILATDIALTQQAQIGQMQGWLAVWGLPVAGTEPAMAWMGHPTEGRMPGMATPVEVNRLRNAPPEEADKLFLRLMIPHHEAAIPMAEAVLEETDRPEVEQLAQAIATSQRAEVKVTQDLLRNMAEEAPANEPPDSSESMPGMDHGVTSRGDQRRGSRQRRNALNSTQAGGGTQGREAIAYTATGLILAAGLVHLALTPEHLEEATYLGLLFGADFAGSVAAALGILRGRPWGWALGALVASGAYALYFVYGSVGLPAVEEAHLFEPLGLLAKVVEASYLLLCAFALTRSFASRGRWTVLATTTAALVALPVAALAIAPVEAEGGATQQNGHHAEEQAEPTAERTSPTGTSDRVSGQERAARAEADCRLATYVAKEGMSPQKADAFSELLADMIRTMEDPSWAVGSLRNAALDHLGVPRYRGCEAGDE